MNRHDEWLEKNQKPDDGGMSHGLEEPFYVLDADDVREYLAKLDAENEKLREALQGIVEESSTHSGGSDTMGEVINEMVLIAEQALKEKDNEG